MQKEKARFLIQLLVLLCLLGQSVLVHGQIAPDQYFADNSEGRAKTIYDYHKVDDGVIITSYVESGSLETPVMLKLDQDGEIVWSTLNTIQPTYLSLRGFELLPSSDGFIYATSLHYNYSTSSTNATFWKVNALTGAVEWTTTFYNSLQTAPRYQYTLADYDSTSLLIYYKIGFATNLATISKADGDTISTREMGPISTSLALDVDENKNVYLARDRKLFKYSLNDFDQLIWQREYTTTAEPLDAISRIYIDRKGKVFLFGEDLGIGTITGENVVIKRINPLNGQQLWETLGSGTAVVLSRFVDKNNKLYCSFRHIYVGGGSSFWQLSKIDKQTGNVDWLNYHHPNYLGTPNSGSSNKEAALALDVDCNGDVYSTGYYGDANYGPEAWGVRKMAGNDGAPIYSLTVTNDPITYDRHSSGLAMCLFGNRPVVLGQLEHDSIDFSAYYAEIHPTDSSVVNGKYIKGDYQHSSQTISLVNQNDSVYAFKQLGNQILLEGYLPNGALAWQFNRGGNTSLLGGQMWVEGDDVFISARQALAQSSVPYYSDTTSAIVLYRINRISGNMADSIALPIGNSIASPFELECDQDTAYLFYTQNDSVKVRKWSGGSLSSDVFLELSGPNHAFSGEINIATNQGGSQIIYAGRSNLFGINKSNLNVANLYNYSAQRQFYALDTLGDTVYLAGQNQLGIPVISAIETSNYSLNWEQTYGNTGAFYQLIHGGDGFLYASGINDSCMGVRQVLPQTGVANWAYHSDSTLYPSTVPLSLELLEERGTLVLAGKQEVGLQNSHAVIDLVNLTGDTLITYQALDETGKQSQANAICMLPDSTFWVGGAHNRLVAPNNGVIFNANGHCISGQPAISLQSDTACVSYFWSVNNQTYTASGTYSDTLINGGLNGCDSIQVLNLTIHPITYGIDTVQACVSYLWPVNNQTYTSSGTYSDTIINGGQNGCDSIQLLDLTIFPVVSGFNTVSACLSYFWPANNQLLTQSGNYQQLMVGGAASGCDSIANLQLMIDTISIGFTTVTNCGSYTWPTTGLTYTVNGTYTDTLVNGSINGCDSISVLNLVVNPYGVSLDTITTCNSFLWPVNGQTYTASGTYTDTLINGSINGCDSVFVLNLVVSPYGVASETITACNSHVWPINGQTYTASGTYTDTLANGSINGCDSVSVLNLIVSPFGVSLDTISACNSFLWPVNGQTYTASGTYTDTLANGSINGCDSIAVLYLMVNPSGISLDTITVCDSIFLWPVNGQSYTTSGVFTDTLAGGATNGCDSISILNLSLISIDTTVTVAGNTMTSNASGTSTFQWIDCQNTSPIAGATGASYVPSADGSYAVVVTNGNCIDTSSCIFVTSVFSFSKLQEKIKVYPNPVNDLLNVELPDQPGLFRLELRNSLGQLIQEWQTTGGKTFQIYRQNLASGAYHLCVFYQNHRVCQSVILAPPN